MKDLSRWDRTKYLNIWTVADIDFNHGGFAFLPFDLAQLQLKRDGIVIDNNYLGNTGTATGNGLHTLSHELGHYLGLFHIWGRNTNDCDKNCHLASDDWINGDRVKDTNPCKNIVFVSGSSDCQALTTNCAGCPIDPMAVYPKDNYMGYAHACQNKFTNGQAERMWYALENCRNSLVSYANQLCTGTLQHFGHNFNITEATTWSASNVPNGNGIITGTVTIENGGSLYISSDVAISFCESGKIIVNPGGTLYLHGKVTNTCQIPWKGIEVMGLSTLPQQPYESHPDHGLVLCRPGSIIENAEVGLLASDGGMISANQSTFRNCNVSVKINPYTSNSDYYAGFTNCTFFTDESYPFESFINLEDVRGVKINGGSFNNSTTSLHSTVEEYGYGIYAINAGFKLKAKINYGALGTYISTNRTSFKGLAFGIFITHDLGNKIYEVEQAQFDHCYFGIYNNGMGLGKILFNDFTLNTVPNAALIPYHFNGKNYGQIGVLLKNDIEGITFENNEFNNTNIEGHTTVGTLLENVGYYDNYIRKNEFINLSISNTSSGLNAWNATYPIGLTYLCNTLTGSENYDFIVVDVPNQIDQIKNHQGLLDPNSTFPNYVWFASGNVFSYNNYAEGDFSNVGGFNIDYHFRIGALNQEPMDYTTISITKRPSDVNTCPNLYCEQPCPTPPASNLQTIKAAYLDLKTGFTNLSSQYFSYTYPTFPSNLPQALERFSPYDPAAPLPINSNPPINTQLNLYKQEMLLKVTAALTTIAEDTNAINLTEYLCWIGQINSYNADVWLAKEYANNYDWNNANIILNYLSTKWALTGVALTEHNYMVELINLFQNNFKDLTANQVNRIIDIRQISDGNSKYVADNILYRLNLGNPVTYHLPNINEITDRSTGTGVYKSKQFNVFPNPTSGELTITWNSLQLESIGFNMFNSLGIQVIDKNLKNNESIKLDNLSGGVYFYQIHSLNGLISSGKITLVK